MKRKSAAPDKLVKISENFWNLRGKSLTITSTPICTPFFMPVLAPNSVMLIKANTTISGTHAKPALKKYLKMTCIKLRVTVKARSTMTAHFSNE